MCWVVALGTFSSDCRSTVPPRPTTTLCRRRGLGAAVIRHGGFAGPHPHPQTFGRVSSCWRRLGSQSYPIHPPTLSDTQDSITNYNVLGMYIRNGNAPSQDLFPPDAPPLCDPTPPQNQKAPCPSPCAARRGTARHGAARHGTATRGKSIGQESREDGGWRRRCGCWR